MGTRRGGTRGGEPASGWLWDSAPQPGIKGPKYTRCTQGGSLSLAIVQRQVAQHDRQTRCTRRVRNPGSFRRIVLPSVRVSSGSEQPRLAHHHTAPREKEERTEAKGHSEANPSSFHTLPNIHNKLCSLLGPHTLSCPGLSIISNYMLGVTWQLHEARNHHIPWVTTVHLYL